MLILLGLATGCGAPDPHTPPELAQGTTPGGTFTVGTITNSPSKTQRVLQPIGNVVVARLADHGIGRTGTATALLLSALGVPWETVRAEYVLSNQYRVAEIERQLERIRQGTAKAWGVSTDKVDMTNVEAFFVVRPEYLDGTLERAVEEHGSIDAHIRDGLGITADDIERLRAELLE